MHRLSTAILFGCVITCMGLGAPAAEIAHDKNTRNSIANLFNHNQLSKIQPEQISRAAVDISTQESDADAVEVGILFLRGDGGDPNELRVDNDTLIYITGRTGEGHTYQNGTEVRIDPVVKESARQIAMQQFVALAGEKLLATELPATAQEAITLFVEGRAKPRIIFARVTSRKDTARVADMRVSEILAMAASLDTDHPRDMIKLVRTAMRTFGFKSDACDGSSDLRCDQPGVREAFAQIKHEEALQQTSGGR